VLYNFTGGGDGAYPLAGVIVGPSRHLYGTTYGGGYGQGLQGDVWCLTLCRNLQSHRPLVPACRERLFNSQ
jgi:hypothetical protein